MAVDDGPSKMSDLATRLDVDAKYAGVYRQRMIDAQMIESAGRGLVAFTVPYMRDYLREHGVMDAHLQAIANEPRKTELPPAE